MITNYFKVAALLMLLLFFNICSASANTVAVPHGISVSVTPGYIDEDKKVTEEKIQILHEYMNNEQYEAIVEDASEIMKNTLGKDVILNLIKNFHQELGKFIKVDDKKMNVIIDSPIQIRAVYVSTFEKGRVTELFNFIKENGRDIKLASYQIMKDSGD